MSCEWHVMYEGHFSLFGLLFPFPFFFLPPNFSASFGWFPPPSPPTFRRVSSFSVLSEFGAFYVLAGFLLLFCFSTFRSSSVLSEWKKKEEKKKKKKKEKEDQKD